MLVYSDGGNAISVRLDSVSEKKVVVKSDARLLVHEHEVSAPAVNASEVMWGGELRN